MIIRTRVFLGFICLVLFPLICHAKIDYISLHEIESADRQPLSVKLNIVEVQPKTQLMFTLINQNAETVLNYQRINSHMLRLNSPHYVVGKASVLAYEFKRKAWRKTHSVDISNSLTPTGTDKKSLIVAPDSKTKCLLIHKPKETLWNIASRYKDRWHVDIFSAMLAIYTTNLSKFTHQHIGQLINNSELLCPSKKTITLMGEKAEMKAEFLRLKSPDYIGTKASVSSSAKTAEKCLLIHEPKETLWKIASRYKESWHVDIFSAMLAIYKTNLSKFTHQHIGQLMSNAELLCPTRKAISMMGEKAAMKAEFIRLKNMPLQ